jgi:formylglycine-generating enzyme required for sulfatase activity
MQVHPDGCVAIPDKIALEGGVPSFRTSDWHPVQKERGSPSRIAPYRMDATEVTVSRWQSCVTAGVCKPVDRQPEPGRPITNIQPQAADKFCRFMGGRLPKTSEWVFAASSGKGRSFPWGPTGLVCRRAAYGLVEGPCAEAAEGPDLAGARPSGGTPEGILDMAGNVAEWTREADGRFSARGGSYRTRVAADLKTWASEPRSTPAEHVGFRCAYPAEDP